MTNAEKVVYWKIGGGRKTQRWFLFFFCVFIFAFYFRAEITFQVVRKLLERSRAAYVRHFMRNGSLGFKEFARCLVKGFC